MEIKYSRSGLTGEVNVQRVERVRERVVGRNSRREVSERAPEPPAAMLDRIAYHSRRRGSFGGGEGGVEPDGHLT